MRESTKKNIDIYAQLVGSDIFFARTVVVFKHFASHDTVNNKRPHLLKLASQYLRRNLLEDHVFFIETPSENIPLPEFSKLNFERLMEFGRSLGGNMILQNTTIPTLGFLDRSMLEDVLLQVDMLFENPISQDLSLRKILLEECKQISMNDCDQSRILEENFLKILVEKLHKKFNTILGIALAKLIAQKLGVEEFTALAGILSAEISQVTEMDASTTTKISELFQEVPKGISGVSAVGRAASSFYGAIAGSGGDGAGIGIAAVLGMNPVILAGAVLGVVAVAGVTSVVVVSQTWNREESMNKFVEKVAAFQMIHMENLKKVVEKNFVSVRLEILTRAAQMETKRGNGLIQCPICN